MQTLFPRVFIFIILSLLAHVSEANDFIEFSPLSQTAVEIPKNTGFSIKYRITNRTKKPQYLKLFPISGITQNSETQEQCSYKRMLMPQQSCILELQIDGSALTENITSGPLLCEFKEGQEEKPSHCFQPLDKKSRLALKSSAEDQAFLTLLPDKRLCFGKEDLTACIIRMTAGSGIPATLTIFNNSTRIFASNIMALLPNDWIDVIEDASNCISLAPRSSCVLRFTPGNSVHAPVSVPVVGNNTTTTFVTLAVDPPTQLPISVTGSPLVMQAGSTQSLIINNLSLSTAFNIHADFTETALSGKLTETVNTCAVVTAGASCTISFTAANAIVPPTNFPIFGSNTTIAIGNIAIQAPFIYIANGGGSGTGISQCFYNTMTGQLGSCTNYLAGTNQPIGIVFNQARTRSYISNQTGSTVTQCDVASGTGTLINCVNSGATGLALPQGIVLNPAQSFAYIVNFAGSSVTQCSINAGPGNLFSCINSGAAALSAPQGIILNAAGTRAYITNIGSNTVTLCAINGTNGQFFGCGNSGATGLNDPRTIAFNSSETFAYITNHNANTVSQCAVNPANGQLMACGNSGATGINAPYGIALDLSNNFAYIGNEGGTNTATVCSIDSLTGNLNFCTNSGATTLVTPTSIAFN